MGGGVVCVAAALAYGQSPCGFTGHCCTILHSWCCYRPMLPCKSLVGWILAVAVHASTMLTLSLLLP